MSDTSDFDKKPKEPFWQALRKAVGEVKEPFWQTAWDDFFRSGIWLFAVMLGVVIGGSYSIGGANGC